MSVGHAMKPMSEAHFAILRRHMVEVIGIQVDLASEELGKAALDERVLAAMRTVPRHRFVPSFLAPLAYHDTPLPIGFDKTISQPFIVALMTDLLGPEPHDSILEVGTGLGYQVGLTRFGGHPEALARGAADAKNTSTIFAGVSPTDGRPRPCWT